MKTIKIKSSDAESQGPFIIINEEDFDASIHEVYDPEAKEEKNPVEMTVAQIKEALAAKQIAIPDGVSKKADLQALLDAAQ